MNLREEDGLLARPPSYGVALGLKLFAVAVAIGVASAVSRALERDRVLRKRRLLCLRSRLCWPRRLLGLLRVAGVSSADWGCHTQSIGADVESFSRQ